MTNRIKEMLNASGQTQRALCDAADVSEGYLSLLFSGKRQPSYDTMHRISAFFGSTPAETFRLDETLGLSEGQAAPWHPPSKADHIGRAAFALQSGLRNPKRYRATRDFPALSIRQNDILVCDAVPNITEGLAIVTVVDPNTGESSTQIRRIHDGMAIAANPLDDVPVLAVNTQSIGIYARVASVVRQTA